MATKLVHGPWLHLEKTTDPSWQDKNWNNWCYAKPPSAVSGFFEIGKEVTEIRFNLSNSANDQSYEVKYAADELSATRQGKTFRWKQIGYGLKVFVSNHPKLTHLSLEVR